MLPRARAGGFDGIDGRIGQRNTKGVHVFPLPHEQVDIGGRQATLHGYPFRHSRLIDYIKYSKESPRDLSNTIIVEYISVMLKTLQGGRLPMSPRQRSVTTATVQSVDRAFHIFEHLIEHGPSSLSDLATNSGLKISTVHNLLSTLMSRGYVRQNAATRLYSASGKVFALANMLKQHIRALPLLEEAAIAGATHETVFIGNLEGLKINHHIVIHGTHALVANPQRGSRLHSTALGKVLLAFTQEPILKQFLAECDLPALTATTITDPGQLCAQLQQIREQRIAFNFGEESASVFGMAVPVFDWSGAAVAGICIGYPAERDNAEYRAQLVALLQEQARAVSENLYYTDKKVSIA